MHKPFYRSIQHILLFKPKPPPFFTPCLLYSHSYSNSIHAKPSITTALNQHTDGQQNQIQSVSKPSVLELLPIYLKLSKARLASLVTLTTVMGYAMAPTATPLLTSSPFHVHTFLATVIGTHLVVTSANTLNQLLESPFDAQMKRTRNRPLVKHLIPPHHALWFATVTGTLGVSILYIATNPLTAILGMSNLILYAFVYTPMKRIHYLNTWIGALVGGIPPLMGWAASTNDISSVNAWILPFVLYSWQFPHFNALSYNIRHDYAVAGYRMLAVTNPLKNARVALQYACVLLPVPFITTYLTHLSTPCFMVTGSLVNGVFAYLAFAFWWNQHYQSARRLFLFSLIHLPVFLGLLLFHKRDDQPKLISKQTTLVNDP